MTYSATLDDAVTLVGVRGEYTNHMRTEEPHISEEISHILGRQD